MIAKVETATNSTGPTNADLKVAKAELDRKIKTRKKTTGEKIYDWTIYQGVGFGANEVGSMWVTGIFERGKNTLIGRPCFEKLEAGLINKFKWKPENANAFLMTASLNLVGCFVVPAIKIIDNHKAGFVKWLNHRFGSEHMTPKQVAERDLEVDTAIACEPTQTWKTLIIGRLVSMCFTISNGTYLCGKKMKDGALNFNEKLQRGFDEVVSAVGRNTGLKKYTDGGKNYYSGVFPKANDPNLNRFHYYAGLMGPETMGCLISSTVLERVSKFTARNFPHVNDPKIYEKEVKKLAQKNFVQRVAGKKSVKETDSFHAAKVSESKTETEHFL